MHKVKGYSSHFLRKEYSWLKQKLPSLWTRSYFVSTAGQVSGDTIKRYVEEQKKSLIEFVRFGLSKPSTNPPYIQRLKHVGFTAISVTVN